MLMCLPKEEPARSTWWINMGHTRDSLPAANNVRCCTQHMDTSVPRKLWQPVPGLLNFVSRPRVARDTESVRQRQLESAEAQRLRERELKTKRVAEAMTNNPMEMVTKWIAAQENTDKSTAELLNLRSKVGSHLYFV